MSTEPPVDGAGGPSTEPPPRPRETAGAEPASDLERSPEQPGAAAGPASLLLAEGLHYTDEELLRALRGRLAELEERASSLELEALAAQARLGALVKQVRLRSEKAERELVRTLVPQARADAVAIVEDARRRASELGIETNPVVEDLGRMLVRHLELQERLVRLVAELTSAAR